MKTFLRSCCWKCSTRVVVSYPSRLRTTWESLRRLRISISTTTTISSGRRTALLRQEPMWPSRLGATPGNLPGGNGISPPFDATDSADSDNPPPQNGVNEAGDFVTLLYVGSL